MNAIARSELILGGQKSGKSRRAEMLAREWLAQSPAHRALLIATGQPWDDEMRARIARHRRERAERVPGLATVEEPRDLAAALARHGAPDTLVVVDCLTLWLTNWLMPASAPEYEQNWPPGQDWKAQAALFLEAVRQAPGPVVLVGNEIGLGVIPLGREVRAFVDVLGTLNQQAAQACARVTLMAAGLPLFLKNP
ncbi:adenosylcobinamide kinase/adenosylcobinamide phosphate guanyltransferase [Alicycliphilus denitrificans]|uniref:bifunctional adenosylcobinamide kinase/adenosylcobinamide-phosphate guanylyltransferase n=1 Tax=Alicycliphilus denitrificans TaxID=179636 RepID=UPI000969267C|nr:bifunctional adenosylcobinamide kinase/adenosylcobinamide-phosphate guanylyltransferase [Alicycliphilus denitrificans]MBN9574623.1 bifunctional adenosylcobinamide kinase/adenosylcobinamide-phosphate guanylyltransferase [Alicycliphilus denitrificans]OJW85896.1 MAG: adenosylcobinamide-phosphate guanylyltransferase [Alicycliphilus sp. 69-12]BCN40232.1 adenosylcobinamide kinase/adenosylcobinamide phosphate guanyltransferase [Alicycliphilus denitrificans]